MLRGTAGSGGTATTATNLAGGAANQIPYQTAASTTAFADGLTFASNAISAMTIAGGTVTTNIPVFSVTRTNNNAAVVKGVEITYTDTTSAAGFLPLAIRGGAAGATDLLTLGKAGLLTVGNGGNSIAQLTFTPNSGTASSLGSANGGSGLLGFIGSTAVVAMQSTGWAVNSNGGLFWTNSTTNPNTTVTTTISQVSGGVLGIGLTAAGQTTGSLSLTNLTASGNVAVATQSPASGAAGTAGTITWDASFIYVCTASGVWKRVGITGGY